MFIQLNQCKTKYILLIVFPIFSFLDYFTSSIIDSKHENFDITTHFFLSSFVESVFGLLSGIPLLFSCLSDIYKRRLTDSFQGTNLMPALPNKSHLKDNTKLILSIIFTILLDQISSFITAAFLSKDPDYVLLHQFTIFQLIFSGLLSYPIIHYPLYRHHYLSIGLICCGFIFTSFNHFSEISQWAVVVYILICYAFWSLSLVITKRIMLTMNINAFKFAFLHYLLNFCRSLVLIIPFMYIPCNLNICSEGVIEPFFESFKIIFSCSHLVGYLVAHSLFTIGYILMMIIINDLMTPTHVSMAEILLNIIIWIHHYFLQSLTVYFYFSLIGYCIIIIGALIYNELIIIKLCSLNLYTQCTITERSDKEFMRLSHFQDLTQDLDE